MKSCYFVLYLYLLVGLSYCGKITVEELKNCEDLAYHILQFKDLKIVTKNDKLQVLGDFIFKEDIGDNFYATTEVFASMGGKKFVKIMSQKDADPCVGLKKNLGAVWEDIQRSGKMAVGQCPLKKGAYHVNTILDLSKIPLPIPPGSLKLLINGFYKNNKKRAYCGEIKIKSE